MKKIVTVLCLALFAAGSPAWAGSNILTWADNSTNEQNFEVWSKVVPTPVLPAVLNCTADTSPYTLLSTLGPNSTTFTHAGLVEGQTYCYEVRATNVAGASAFSNQAGRSVPFTVAAAPSGLIVTGGP